MQARLCGNALDEPLNRRPQLAAVAPCNDDGRLEPATGSAGRRVERRGPRHPRTSGAERADYAPARRTEVPPRPPAPQELSRGGHAGDPDPGGDDEHEEAAE